MRKCVIIWFRSSYNRIHILSIKSAVFTYVTGSCLPRQAPPFIDLFQSQFIVLADPDIHIADNYIIRREPSSLHLLGFLPSTLKVDSFRTPLTLTDCLWFGSTGHCSSFEVVERTVLRFRLAKYRTGLKALYTDAVSTSREARQERSSSRRLTVAGQSSLENSSLPGLLSSGVEGRRLPDCGSKKHSPTVSWSLKVPTMILETREQTLAGGMSLEAEGCDAHLHLPTSSSSS